VLRTAEQHFERAAATLNRRAAALYLNVQRQSGGARESSSDGNGASDAAEKRDALYCACRTAVDTAVQAVVEVSALTAVRSNVVQPAHSMLCSVPASRAHATRQ